MIRTPDQRVRVFVSSTLQELADERKVIRKAIEELHLIPVMFELGARPHPPRLLYQSYVQQSDIFIGVYWNSYGWIAEDMSISGLEDEYHLSENKSRLLYIKSSREREPRLVEMLGDIRKQGDLSYKSFHDLEELRHLVTNDLASLLSEGFLGQIDIAPAEKKIFFNNIPAPFHELIGRDRELQEIQNLFVNENYRLINLLGMGGTGKSRLAIELAQKMLGDFKHGACFAALACIKEHEQLEIFIASLFGITDSAKQTLRETLLSYLSDKELLLILDNFEHVLPGAELISDILSRCRNVHILVTSRSPLNLIAEHLYPLSPLALPAKQPRELSEAMEVPSLKLFIERTRSINPNISWQDENLRAATAICERLGGLPLAIELVAMRFRHSTPIAIINGMQKSLDLLSTGARDLPERQKSFRATLAWSYDLLNETDKTIFRVSSLFRNGWYLDSLSFVSGMALDNCLACIERLIDVGLIRIRNIEGQQYRYDNLQPITEYAQELFEADPNANQYRDTFVNYYIQASSQIDHSDYTEVQTNNWLDFVLTDYENLRTAYRLAVAKGSLIELLTLVNSCCSYWTLSGRHSEGLLWIREGGIMDLHDWESLNEDEIRLLAYNTLYRGSFHFYLAHFAESKVILSRAISMYAKFNDQFGTGRCHLYLALCGLSTGDPECKHHFDCAMTLSKQQHDKISEFLANVLLIEYYAQKGDFEGIQNQMQWVEQVMGLSKKGGAYSGIEALYAVYYLIKANINLAMRKDDEAYAAYSKANELFEVNRLKSSWGFALEGLAVIHLLKGEYAEAEKYAMIGLNKGREQGDLIIILTTLRLLISCFVAAKSKYNFLPLLQEIDGHFHELKYKFWSIDQTAFNWLDQYMKENNILYEFQPGQKRGSLDQLIRETLSMKEN